MTELAIEKLSPIAWWSVLLTNISTLFGFLIFTSGILLGYRSIQGDFDWTQAFFASLFLIFGFRSFMTHYFNGSVVRRLRYSGTIETVKKLDGTRKILMPGWAFRDKAESALIIKELDRILAELEDEEERSMIYVLGFDKDSDPQFRLKLIHGCSDLAECDKIHLHSSGYNETRDGALSWTKV